MAERQNKMVKSMHAAAWQEALAHCAKRQETMADFAARAFRHMIAADNAAPMFTLPAERAARQPAGQAAPAALTVAPLPISSGADFAAWMAGAAHLASASGVPVPKVHARSAYAALGASLRAARGLPPVRRKGSPA